VPCALDEPICKTCQNEEPFCFFYETVFTKLEVRLPLFSFEKDILNVLNVAPCTALVVGSNDVASSYCIGVLRGRQAGRREGGRGVRVVTSYQVGVFRSPSHQYRRSPS